MKERQSTRGMETAGTWVETKSQEPLLAPAIVCVSYETAAARRSDGHWAACNSQPAGWPPSGVGARNGRQRTLKRQLELPGFGCRSQVPARQAGAANARQPVPTRRRQLRFAWSN
jgi:hypothetical protein